ncbi:glyoxalase family protein [Purpureocillium lavendulum]|uniref:Glyoxalase family protein n=1 Tax=Purpureocillium lavendulum TaxID=1247861 RepID=A0AB34FIH1_9HYPO|nr:glyoxalase family protein [Purpureocillium lavendulum]
MPERVELGRLSSGPTPSPQACPSNGHSGGYMGVAGHMQPRSQGEPDVAPSEDSVLPLSEDDEELTGYPKLNFTPLPLKLWYLISSTVWYASCAAAIALLLYLQARAAEAEYDLFFLENEQIPLAYTYTPNIVWFVTFLLWKSSYQSYIKLMPYYHMASISLDPARRSEYRNKAKKQHCIHEPFTGRPFYYWSPRSTLTLLKGRDYFTLFLYVNQVLVILLLPVKSSLIAWLEIINGDGKIRGSQAGVSRMFGICGAAIYVSLMCCSICLAIQVFRADTGLKWCPYSLAAQAALIQGSNVLAQFSDMDMATPRAFRKCLSQWPEKNLILRLGYWKHESSGHIFHGEVTRSEPPIDRLDSFWIGDAYLIMISIITVVELLVLSVVKADGGLDKLYSYRPVSKQPPPPQGNWASELENHLLFNFIPALPFTVILFNIKCVDIYNRTMAPIDKMAQMVTEKERLRLGLSEGAKGATAKDSMLLDYLSPNAVSCIIKAVMRGDLKIAFGALLATLGTSVLVFVAPIFNLTYTFIDGRYRLEVRNEVIEAAFVVLPALLVAIWVLRPRGIVRTCPPPFTLLDFASLVHQSPLQFCPDFSLDSKTDTEAHLAAQITIADRIYRFGNYRGLNGQQYLGIANTIVPEEWYEASSGGVPAHSDLVFDTYVEAPRLSDTTARSTAARPKSL